MLVIKIFSERKNVFRERKKCEKIRAKKSDFLQGVEGKRKGLVTHDLEGYGLEKTCNNDKNLSEIQLEHENEDEFVVVVVVKEIVIRLLEEEEKLEWWFEQDIDKEEERFEGDKDGGEVAKLGDYIMRRIG
ncbi:hypothetical protein Tco_0817989 [Tanacetum coccineum]